MTAAHEMPSFEALAGTAVEIKIVDIGANPIDGPAPYAPMLRHGRTGIVGFEPNPEALARLNALKAPEDLYLSHAVGDGRQHSLNVCQAPGMTSLLQPDANVLAMFSGFPEWGRVMATLPVDTVRLDDVEETVGLDLLKIDIQGAELMVFQNAVARLADVLVIHTEVEFLPLYVNQPLFSEVERFLRASGFMFHRFIDTASRVIKPLVIDDNPYAGLGQLVWSDAVFIKDIMHPERLSDRQILAMARIMHECYGAFDIVIRLLQSYDARWSTTLQRVYMDGLRSHASATST